MMGLETHMIGYAALFYEIRIAGKEFILGNIHAKKKDQISPKELEIIKGKDYFHWNIRFSKLLYFYEKRLGYKGV